VTLTDDRGAPLRLDESAHGTIVVLGYTRCTDVCPVTLAKLATLHRYLGAWENAIVGATGSPTTLARLFVALGAGDGRASVRDHDARVFVVDRYGDVRAELAADATPATIGATLRALAAERG
ncbi:MAG: SCO family protein, partial [Vulcanimicrobiaceae bacterium]